MVEEIVYISIDIVESNLSEALHCDTIILSDKTLHSINMIPLN